MMVITGVFFSGGEGCGGVNNVSLVTSQMSISIHYDILVGVDFKDFFHNFSDGERFLKKLKQGKGL